MAQQWGKELPQRQAQARVGRLPTPGQAGVMQHLSKDIWFSCHSPLNMFFFSIVVCVVLGFIIFSFTPPFCLSTSITDANLHSIPDVQF
jgi:hypothetical protein